MWLNKEELDGLLKMAKRESEGEKQALSLWRGVAILSVQSSGVGSGSVGCIYHEVVK